MKIVKEGGVSMQEKLNYKRTFFVGLEKRWQGF